MAPGLTCLCGDAGMQAVCELPQSGSSEIMAYVAYAVIGMMLTRSLGGCVDDDDDERSGRCLRWQLLGAMPLVFCEPPVAALFSRESTTVKRSAM